MLELLLLIAVLGFVCWLLITYVPMPPPFQALIVLIAVLIIVFTLFGGGLGSLGLHTRCL